MAYLTWLDHSWTAGRSTGTTGSVGTGTGSAVVLCTGTVPTWSLTRLADQDYGSAALPVRDLPVDPEQWPDPATDWAAEHGWQLRRHGLMGYPLTDRRGATAASSSTPRDSDTATPGAGAHVRAAELIRDRGKHPSGRTLADRAGNKQPPEPLSQPPQPQEPA